MKEPNIKKTGNNKVRILMSMIKSKKRVRDIGEVFTQSETVDEMISLIQEEEWEDKSFIVLEPTCGNGNFLVEIVRKKMQCGLTFLQALNTTFGTDICPENIDEARHRLLFLKKVNMKDRRVATCIIHHNIFVVEDFLKTTKQIQERPFFMQTRGNKGLSKYILDNGKLKSRGFLSKEKKEKVKNKIKNIKIDNSFDFVTILGDNTVFNDPPEIKKVEVNDQRRLFINNPSINKKKKETNCQRYVEFN